MFQDAPIDRFKYTYGKTDSHDVQIQAICQKVRLYYPSETVRVNQGFGQALSLVIYFSSA